MAAARDRLSVCVVVGAACVALGCFWVLAYRVKSGMLSSQTNQTHEAQVYSHGRPIRCRKPLPTWASADSAADCVATGPSSLCFAALCQFGAPLSACGVCHVCSLWDMWDAYMEPLTSRVPTHVAVGNHEHCFNPQRDQSPVATCAPPLTPGCSERW